MGIGTVTGALALAVVGSGTGHVTAADPGAPVAVAAVATAGCLCRCVCVCSTAATMHVPLCKAGTLQALWHSVCTCVGMGAGAVCAYAVTGGLASGQGRWRPPAAAAAAGAAAGGRGLWGGVDDDGGRVRGRRGGGGGIRALLLLALGLLAALSRCVRAGAALEPQEAVRDTAGSLCSRVVAGGGAWHGFVASLQEVCDADGSLLCCMDVGGPWRGIVTSLQEEVLTAAASPDFLTCPQDCLHVLAAYPRPLLLPPVSFAWPQLDTHDTGDCVPHCLLPTLPVLLCGCSCAALLGSGGGASQWDAQDEAQDAADWVVWEPCTRAPEAPPVLPPGCGCPWGSAAAAAAAPVGDCGGAAAVASHVP
eukprot:scaffold156024_cov18-Tisochrysis_lutea.AAC.3